MSAELHWIIVMQHQAAEGGALVTSSSEGRITPGVDDTRQSVYLQIMDLTRERLNLPASSAVTFFSLEPNRLPGVAPESGNNARSYSYYDASEAERNR